MALHIHSFISPDTIKLLGRFYDLRSVSYRNISFVKLLGWNYVLFRGYVPYRTMTYLVLCLILYGVAFESRRCAEFYTIKH
jgi:hypothetical protein